MAGRPHVFGVSARAIPLSAGGGSMLEQGIDVALLMTPRTDEPFAMRAPRGTLGSGRHFVLRCPGLERKRGALARTTAVSELGIQFDLVTAEMVRATEERPRHDPEPGASGYIAARGSHASVQMESIDVPREAELGERAGHHVRLQQHASASAVQIGGATTIGAEVSTTLLSPVQMGETVKLVGPRGEIAPGAYFALRYFDTAGAKRALMRAEAVRPKPGMLDVIEAILIRLPTPAEERQSYRAPFDSLFNAHVEGRNGLRTFRGRITDLSAGGVGFRSTSSLATGDRLRIADPTLPELDGAELLVVRRDARDGQRYGARFVEPSRGEEALSTILGIERAERDHRRHRQVEEIRRARAATASPLTDADIQALRNRRMGTRSHDGLPGQRRYPEP